MLPIHALPTTMPMPREASPRTEDQQKKDFLQFEQGFR
jgi:hypothetical protein